jgi:hypothetical protein
LGVGARAYEAFERRDWAAAYEGFLACGELGADDQDALAESAHWLGLVDGVIEAYRDAYRLHLDAGSPRRASQSAFHARHLPTAPGA